jgi:hypothetical protein
MMRKTMTDRGVVAAASFLLRLARGRYIAFQPDGGGIYGVIFARHSASLLHSIPLNLQRCGIGLYVPYLVDDFS